MLSASNPDLVRFSLPCRGRGRGHGGNGKKREGGLDACLAGWSIDYRGD